MIARVDVQSDIKGREKTSLGGCGLGTPERSKFILTVRSGREGLEREGSRVGAISTLAPI